MGGRNMIIYDRWFGRVMTRVFDLIILNLIFVVTILPLFTIGASISALNATMLKIVEVNDDRLYQYYWKTFISNFKQGTIWGIMVTFIFLLLLNTLNYLLTLGIFSNVLIRFSQFVFILVIPIVTYSFFLLPKFKTSYYDLVKNSFFIAISFLPETILMMLITFGPLCLALFINVQVYGMLIYFYLLIGIALTCYLNAFIINHVLNHLVTKHKFL